MTAATPSSRRSTTKGPSPRGDGGARLRGLLVLGLVVLMSPWSTPVQAAGDPYDAMRVWMVDQQIRRRGVEDSGVLAAMERVPRHKFVPLTLQPRAYEDQPLDLGRGQTMNQAYLTGLMISLLELDGDEKVLEIGTGSGYDAAVLSRVAREVFTIEIDPILAERARTALSDLSYANVHVRNGDGWHGWEEEAPFDAILVTAAPRAIPEPLYEQLAVGGRMVVALGGFVQDLQVVIKGEDGRRIQKITPVRLGAMSGEAARDR